MMWLFCLIVVFVCFASLIFWLSRPVSGGMKLNDWRVRDELSDVPRSENGVPFVGNGWYCICDERDLSSSLTVRCLGRVFNVRREDADVVVVSDDQGTIWAVERVLEMILVWYDAEGRDPTYFNSQIAPSIPKNLVFHGKMQHEVRCLLQDIPENGADYAHFKQVHEDGEKSFGLIGKLLKLRLMFQGSWWGSFSCCM